MSRGIWAGLASAIALGGGMIAVVVNQSGGGSAVPAGFANVFVTTSASGDTCTRYATPVSYITADSENKLCTFFDAALDVASCGDLVIVRAGSYGSQTLSGNKGCSIGQYVTLQGDDAASDHGIVLSNLAFAEENAQGIALRKMFVNGSFAVRRTDNILLDNVDNGGIFFESVADLQMKNSEVVCPGTDNGCDYHSQITAQYCTPACNSTHHDPRRVTIGPNNYFHGWQAISVGQHTECLQVGGGDGDGDTTPGAGVLITGNKFNECCHVNLLGLTDTCTAGLHLTDYNNVGFDGHETSEVSIENNWFGPDMGNQAIQYGEYDNSAIKFNSSPGLMIDVCGGCTGSPFYYIGNNVDYAPGMCSGSHTFRYNNFAGGTCDATDVNGANDFVDATGTDFDLHLATNTSSPNNLVPTSVITGCPAQDFDLENRPINTNCDAGSDERG